MDVLYFLAPLAIMLGLVGLIGMYWAWKQGQFDDLEGPAHRILFDDDGELDPHAKKNEDAQINDAVQNKSESDLKEK
ncbi:cbb3-type cytochrome oxidase assembly protein CcoS [Magnetofaba australis]|uniref:Putative cbb3-type cytochrome oxidase maturation protein n=1 Tax=Magnetofaba australis IT-1 TaxID=1434232 RepID=A0A1Y2K4G9_9PROT|nr:cbb3-type cytochrome oxidase assembly protein CcoS [Magnetofaba australis]OSM02536.1 putative cbb3-type cytochrome oxidase maturation protein [Magnetofaba australis IT-1]